jgi:NTP pyrophosphatase (non-canonical NTP hydrolase)
VSVIITSSKIIPGASFRRLGAKNVKIDSAVIPLSGKENSVTVAVTDGTKMNLSVENIRVQEINEIAIAKLNKLEEETQEVRDAIESGDEKAFKDAIGDTIISAVNLAKMKGFNAEDCVNLAYNEIKDRKGKMLNGEFVKNI